MHFTLHVKGKYFVDGKSLPKPRSTSKVTSSRHTPRRACVIVAGETRSANRTEWSQAIVQPVVAAARKPGPDQEVKDLVCSPWRPCLPIMSSEGTVHGGKDITEDGDEREHPPVLGHQVWSAAAHLAPAFTEIDHLVAANLRRVQAAMARARLGPHHFAGSSGYGHGDLGRAALDEVAPSFCSLHALCAVPCTSSRAVPRSKEAPSLLFRKWYLSIP